MFTADYLELAGGRRVYYVHSAPAHAKATPVLAIHGLGGSSSFWLPALECSNLPADRDVYAYDFDGHGQSDFSGREPSMDNFVADLEEIVAALQLERIVLLGHSMNGIVTSLYAAKHPDKVEKLVLLHPVRNLPDAAKANMKARAEAASTAKGLSTIANTVASGAVAKVVAASDHTTTAFIRDLVATTKPEAYAAACRALASAPGIKGADVQCPVHIIGGAEDYLAGPEAVKAWAAEIPNGGSATVLQNVGHWGALEAPLKVGRCLAQALAPSEYSILLGTFRSPYLYTLSFDAHKGKLALQHTNEASGGHNWLDVSKDGRTLYATVWGEKPSLTSYEIVPANKNTPHVTTRVQRTVGSKFLSGYVVANDKMAYSACGPQVDVFELDPDTGALLDKPAVQSFSLVDEDGRHKGNGTMDFGGLRHGGHSADLSPDGTKLYVADIGRNCVWLYNVDQETGRLTEGSKNIATRPHDGPRHAWPHPNGRIVYSLQEHSSYVDVFRLTDDGTLEFVEGGNILPEGDECGKYWADEVRLSPFADVVFGSTRGLESGTNGWVTAWRLRPDGTLADGDKAAHRFETKSSGGWANAIAVCPTPGPKGETFMTLTDSEDASIQILSYTPEEGFKVVDTVEVKRDDEHGSSVAVWL